MAERSSRWLCLTSRFRKVPSPPLAQDNVAEEKNRRAADRTIPPTAPAAAVGDGRREECHICENRLWHLVFIMTSHNGREDTVQNWKKDGAEWRNLSPWMLNSFELIFYSWVCLEKCLHITYTLFTSGADFWWHWEGLFFKYFIHSVKNFHSVGINQVFTNQ